LFANKHALTANGREFQEGEGKKGAKLSFPSDRNDRDMRRNTT